jgi:hypothetical protein
MEKHSWNNEVVVAVYHRNHMNFVFNTHAMMLENVASVIVVRIVSKLCLFCCCRCYLWNPNRRIYAEFWLCLIGQRGSWSGVVSGYGDGGDGGAVYVDFWGDVTKRTESGSRRKQQRQQKNWNQNICLQNNEHQNEWQKTINTKTNTRGLHRLRNSAAALSSL